MDSENANKILFVGESLSISKIDAIIIFLVTENAFKRYVNFLSMVLASRYSR